MTATTFCFFFSTVPSFGKMQQQKEKIQNKANSHRITEW